MNGDFTSEATPCHLLPIVWPELWPCLNWLDSYAEEIEVELPKLRRSSRKATARDHKRARILARQIARSEHHIRARPLLRNGKAWRS